VALGSAAHLTLNPLQARALAAIVERIFPADASAPGAVEIGVVDYVDRALNGVYRDKVETYRLGLIALDNAARAAYDQSFADCSANQQDQLLTQLERGELATSAPANQVEFFEMVRLHAIEGLFSDPIHGGNRDKLGWRILGHPGVWLDHTFEESMSDAPADKGGVIQSLADLDLSSIYATSPRQPIEASHSSVRGPLAPVDVVVVGLGGMGGIVAPTFARAGLRTVALEAGPWRTGSDFRPDELTFAFYARAGLATKFMAEAPRWRRSEDEPTREATFSLGRMVNGVGGSILHYGAWLRRFHPYHFQPLTHVRERWGEAVLPANSTLVDWPITYDDLEPYFTRVEHLVGVSGDDLNPFVPRSAPLPMPPLRPFRTGEAFREATTAMGLHPTAVPVGVNSVEYDGRPALRYNTWNSLWSSLDGDRWQPGFNTIPQALATGNFEIRTHSRVVRVNTDRDGHVTGVDYVDGNGVLQTQAARTVILACYTFEAARLMWLSGDARRPGGLGNTTGQLGKNFMAKMFSDVMGYFPNTIWNRHTGPAAQSLILDDFVSADFDSAAHGFVGGATLSAENSGMPLQITRTPPPPDVPRWGQPFKDFLRDWQHVAFVRIQSDALPYRQNYFDLDPFYRDRSGIGMPVARITYELQPNEHRQSAWFEEKSEEILRAMGAVKTWRGPRFTGVCSSHDLGGCRMGNDPATSVVNADLAVHDTPGLYVFSGATFPSCPGINPTLTMWAVCCRAADRLVERLARGEEK
jgi:gluconate 2-dehydrogenase alpha chain